MAAQDEPADGADGIVVAVPGWLIGGLVVMLLVLIVLVAMSIDAPRRCARWQTSGYYIDEKRTDFVVTTRCLAWQ